MDSAVPAAPGRVPVDTPCPNCGACITGRWCSTCGQRWAPVDPTWHDVVQETADELLHWDSKIAVTLRLLLTRPGELTAELLQGRRARYVAPLRLYLTASLVYFLLRALLPDADFNAAPVDPATLADRPDMRVLGQVFSALPNVIFAMVPAFAGLVWLMYRGARRHYPAFLFFALHVHAALFSLLSLTVPIQSFATDLWITAGQLTVFLWMSGYLALALRRVFGGTRAEATRRAIAIVLLHMLLFGIVLAGLAVMLTQLQPVAAR